MNKFKKLAEKLIKVKLWRSKISLTQVSQKKNENGQVIYVPEITKEVNCVKKELNKLNQNDFLNYDCEFIRI